MQDAYLPIALALARPLRAPSTGVWLHQLWRADFAALARLALVCKDAADAVRRMLWTCTKLGERERARRVQVERARRFLRMPSIAALIVSASWTREFGYDGERAHIRCVTSVAFNGRIRIRECFFPGRRSRRRARPMASATNHVGMTLTSAKRGRVLIWDSGPGSSWRDVLTGTFTNADGAPGSMRFLTHLGREHWAQSQPAEYQRLRRYRDCMEADLRFEVIVARR
jgi:hypothetical protein